MKKPTTRTSFHNRKRIRVQADFLQKLGELLAEGFSMKDALQFLAILSPKQSGWIEEVQRGMAKGGRLDEELGRAGFPERITSQLFLAQVHGRFSETLIGCGRQLKDQSKKTQELAALCQYPLLLVVFLVGMLLGMRFILLPHMESLSGLSGNNETGLAYLAVGLVYYSPQWLLILSGAGGLVSCLLYAVLKRKRALEKAAFYVKVPLLNRFVRLYYTYRFAQEWSLLFRSGLTIQEIIDLMQEKGVSRLMQEVGKEMGKMLLQGYSLKDSLEQFSFLSNELGYIILHGETTGNLSTELGMYAKDCLTELNRKVEQSFQYIQPVLFLLIALMVISIYAALLLPMFSMVKEMG